VELVVLAEVDHQPHHHRVLMELITLVVVALE